MAYKKRIQTAAQFIQDKIGQTPKVAIVCGSGLGSIAEEITSQTVLEYSSIPGFPVGTVAGHSNRLISGFIGKTPVLAFQGRFHYYEGYSMADVTLQARVSKALGVSTYLVTNAAGGLNRNFEVGDIMLIEDHVNFMFQNPLVGPNDDTLGPRFPDMSEPYCQKTVNELAQIALEKKIPFHRGVYLAVTGPSYETRAELRFFATVADAVGMSTVPEVIVAVHGGIPRCIGLSVITNKATGEDTHKESHEAVVNAAKEATPRMVSLVKAWCETRGAI